MMAEHMALHFSQIVYKHDVYEITLDIPCTGAKTTCKIHFKKIVLF